MKSVYLSERKDTITRVYAPETRALLKEIAGAEDQVYTKAEVLAQPELFADTQYAFATWGMSQYTEEEIRQVFPKLECIFYGAGSVQYFARPFLNCGIKVFSAWAANAVPVAEYTVAQIILANKGFYAASRLMSVGDRKAAYDAFAGQPGNYGATVGIIGAGMIGRLVIQMLKAYKLKVKVVSSMSEEKAAAMGVEKCTLEELFATCHVVSNHLANNEQTKGMLNGKLFDSMPTKATFINTGRGAQVVEEDLINTLRNRPDITAVLDVTYPEPPVEGSPFYELPNCVLTPHIAGSSGQEVHRMSEYMVEEYRKYITGEACQYEVTLDMLETMA